MRIPGSRVLTGYYVVAQVTIVACAWIQRRDQEAKRCFQQDGEEMVALSAQSPTNRGDSFYLGDHR